MAQLTEIIEKIFYFVFNQLPKSFETSKNHGFTDFPALTIFFFTDEKEFSGEKKIAP